MPLVFDPPEKLRDRADWIKDVEDRVAEFVAREIVSISREVTNAYFNSLVAAGDEAVFDAIPIRWDSFVSNELIETFVRLYFDGSIGVWMQAPGVAALGADFASGWTSVVNVEAVEYARTVPNRMKDVGDHLWNNLRQDVVKAIETGDVRDRLAKTLQETGDFSRRRAMVIARTEVIGAYNAGSFAGGAALGEFGPVEKYWGTGLDERVRPEHAAAEGQTVPFALPFVVGGEQLMYPGDQSGSPWNVIMCRCSMFELYPGDSRPDGSVVPG